MPDDLGDLDRAIGKTKRDLAGQRVGERFAVELCRGEARRVADFGEHAAPLLVLRGPLEEDLDLLAVDFERRLLLHEILDGRSYLAHARDVLTSALSDAETVWDRGPNPSQRAFCAFFLDAPVSVFAEAAVADKTLAVFATAGERTRDPALRAAMWRMEDAKALWNQLLADADAEINKKAGVSGRMQLGDQAPLDVGLTGRDGSRTTMGQLLAEGRHKAGLLLVVLRHFG